MIAAGIGAAGSMFLSAAIIMLPIAMVLLMINVTVGIISRSAPTLNLFSFGFPITLISVFILLYVSVGVWEKCAKSLIDSGLSSSTMIGLLPMAEENQDGQEKTEEPTNSGYKKQPRMAAFTSRR